MRLGIPGLQFQCLFVLLDSTFTPPVVQQHIAEIQKGFRSMGGIFYQLFRECEGIGITCQFVKRSGFVQPRFKKLGGEGERFIEPLHCLLGAVLRHAPLAQIAQHLGVIGAQGQCLVVSSTGSGVVPQMAMRRADAAPQGRIIRLLDRRLVQIGEGIGGITTPQRTAS